MIVNDFQNMRYLNLISVLLEYQSVRMNQIHRILPFPVLYQRMTPANMKPNHHLHSIRCSDFIYTQMKLFRQIFAICSLCCFGIRTNFFNFLIFVRDIQVITSFLIYLRGNFMIVQIACSVKNIIYP